MARKPSNIRVTVNQGHVRFGQRGWFNDPINLTSGQAGVLTDRGMSRETVAPQGVARWRNEWAEYHDATLGEVIADMQATSPLPIRITESALADLRVSGRIRLTDPRSQLANLAYIHDFTVHENGMNIVLSRP